MYGKGGGIDRYLLNFLEAVQDQDVEIDFLTDKVDKELETYLRAYRSEIYAVAGLKHPVKQFRQVCAILRRKQYDMVYLNVSTAIDCVAAFAAKHMKVRERAIHSHSSGNDCESSVQRLVYNVAHRICKAFCWRAGTRFYGCSVKAGRWLFPGKIVESDRFEVIYNAVDRRKYQYHPDWRKEMRAGLGVEGKFVVGSIGNFCYQKNYPFLIDVFEQLYKLENDAVLLLAGKGVQLDAIRRRVKEKGLEDAVKFLGFREDADRLYQAMDVFLLPSRFEGLPVVGVEAQSSKLPCVLSSSITPETKIQDHCYFLDLKAGPKRWAQFIAEHREYDREQVKLLKEAKNYDLEIQTEQLRRIVCH